MNIFTVLYTVFPFILAAAGSLVLGQQFAESAHGDEATLWDRETWRLSFAIFGALLIISVALAAVELVASWFA